MNESTDGQRRTWGIVVLLLLLVLLSSVANIIFTLQLRDQVRSFREVKQRSSELPCAAIPTRFILEDPVCAQKLLTVMNVTNVRVESNASRLRGFDRWKNGTSKNSSWLP